MRAVAGVLLLLILAAPAYGQDTGTSISEPLEWGSAFSWVDANADGKADYCRVESGPRAACTLSTGAGFGATIVSGPIDAGFGEARLWGDVDGDRRADYCRRVGGGAVGNRIQCTRSTGDGFVTDAPSAPLDWGLAPDTALADATGDGAADYCRLTGAEQTPNATCTTSVGSGFTGEGSAGPLNPGDAAGRAWADFDGDGRADFCRVAGGTALCTGLSGSTVTSGALDAGWPAGRAWADVNADGKADYCRRVGDAPNTFMQCTHSTGSGFGPSITSGRIEWGHDAGYAWVDFDGDGDKDFCRPAGASVTTSQLYCTLWTGADGFGVTRVSGVLDLGYAEGRAWVDHNGDGKADYCRRVGGAGANERISCTISNGTGFGVAPPPPPPAAPAPPPAPTPTAPGRITVTLSFYLSRSRFTTLAVKGVPRGSKVVATCSKGCARKRYTKRNARGTVSLKKLVGGRRMKVGAKITVTVTHAGRIGAVKTLQIRSGRRNPKLTTRCIPIGSTKPRTRC
jgi:hypothetical protein